MAVEAARSRDLTQFREKVRLLRAHSASPALPPAPAKVAAISQVRLEDIEEMPSEPQTALTACPRSPRIRCAGHGKARRKGAHEVSQEGWFFVVWLALFNGLACHLSFSLRPRRFPRSTGLPTASHQQSASQRPKRASGSL